MNQTPVRGARMIPLNLHPRPARALAARFAYTVEVTMTAVHLAARVVFGVAVFIALGLVPA